MVYLTSFQNLRLLLHGGGNFFYNLGRIEQGFIQRPDLCVDNKINPKKYLDKFYVDSLVHSPESLKFLIDSIGSERIALGSDYPFPLGEEIPGKIIESIHDLSNFEKENIYYKTALDWLSLDINNFI